MGVKRRNSGYRVLLCLIRLKGGPTKLGKLANESKQTIVEWRNRGLVPFRKLRNFSDILGVPTYLLNYADVKAYTPDIPSWNETVTKAPFLTAEMKRWILAAGDP
jgi:hypothetical protein